MKDAKDYIREDGSGRTSITSLAYWLTPEGLSNSMTAAMLRELINTSTDAEFIEAFDGATKNDATEVIAAYELCSMPYWGADELAKAIQGSDGGRDEKLVFRAVELAQKASELPEVFKPSQGIEWAMDRGYLIGLHAAFTGVNTGTYGHPSNALQDGPHHSNIKPQAVADAPAKPMQRSTAQDTAIIDAIKQAGLDPLALPKNKPGKSGVKATIRAALVRKNSLFPSVGRQFDKAWERLRKSGEIADKQ